MQQLLLHWLADVATVLCLPLKSLFVSTLFAISSALPFALFLFALFEAFGLCHAATALFRLLLTSFSLLLLFFCFLLSFAPVAFAL